DLPIEVRYNSLKRSYGGNYPSAGVGIDLFWATPDSPRNASGKPIAEIVPSDALYTEPPGPVEKAEVRSPNSMIRHDHLYFPTAYTEEAVTVTIRLADKDGRPVAGKHVYLSSLPSVGYSDTITQPDKPTDERGETNAKIRANATYPVEHDSTIF